jgi:hypothetical protein
MARDPRISEIFYYFEKHTTIAGGRTVGRKIGVVQEILCKKHLLISSAVRDCVIYEPKLAGRSGATHKVEFVLFKPAAVVELSVGKPYPVSPTLALTLLGTDSAAHAAKFSIAAGAKKKRVTVRPRLVMTVPDSSHVLKLVKADATAVRFSILDTHKPVASIESKRVGAQRFSGSEKLGSGIQTIEKAKQASLVAIDFDLKYNGTLLAQSASGANRSFRSFVVLGNGIHWTVNDLAILETYVDYTYLVDDAAVVRYAEFVRKLSLDSKADFFNYFMTYFQGMTNTPPDAFTVTAADFVPMRPSGAGSFLDAVQRQIPSYKVTVI